MARRNSNQSSNTPDNAPEENVVSEQATEETVAEATTETTDSAPAEATTSTEDSAPVEIDLSGFESAVANAIENRDQSTGVVPEAFIAEVNTAYRALDGVKAKSAAKKFVGDGMKSALTNMDLTTARAYMNLQEKLSAQGGGGTKAPVEKVPADPHEALAQQFAVLRLANDNVVIGEEIDRQKLSELIEKLIADAADGVSTYIAYLTTETPEGEDEPAEPEVEGYVKNAAKLALGRSAKAGAAKGKSTGGATYSGPRRDVAAHIRNAFADKASGHFMTIAQIADTKSDEYTDANGTFTKPSQGAISARLFPSGEGKSSTVEGVVPDTQDGKKGARKA